MSETTDHSHYIDAIIKALDAAGLTVIEGEALEDEDRSAYITLASPSIEAALGGGAELHLIWSDGDGWNVLYRTDPRETWGSIDTFRTLDFLDTVAPPRHIAAAVSHLLAIHSDADMRTADEMLADYFPAGSAHEPDPSDPRQTDRHSCDGDPIECAHEAACGQAEEKARRLPEFLADVRQLIAEYSDDERGVIAAMGFEASLDQLALEKYGISEQEAEANS